MAHGEFSPERASSLLPQATQPGIPLCCLAERANTAHGRQWVSLHPASLTLCHVFVSASPARSPVFSHLASSLQGLWTIRAYKAEQRFQELFDSHQDLHSGL